MCENKQVRTDLLEEAVWEDLSSLLKNPKRVAEEYERRLRRTDKDGADFHELTSLIQKVKLAIARLIDAYQDGLLSRDEFQPRISRSKERLGKLEAEAATLTSRQSEADELRLTIGHLQEFHRHLHEGLEHVDWKTKREIIRALVKRVEIGDQFVRVVYRVSPPPFAAGPASGACLQHCGRRDLADVE